MGDAPLLDGQAIREAMLDRLPAAHMLQLSTHGTKVAERDQTVLDYRNLLAGATASRCRRFMTEPSRSRMCRSSVSTCVLRQVVHRGAEAMGFTRAFLEAGAGVVLVPIWAMEDTATAHLMEGWYRELVRPERPGMAACPRAVLALRQREQ